MKKIFVILLCLTMAGCSSTKTSVIQEQDMINEQALVSDPTPVIEEEQPFVNTGEPEKKEMTGKEVQMALKNAGYYDGKVDGIIGTGTRDAILRFQRDHGLFSDSIAGPDTKKKLRGYLDQ